MPKDITDMKDKALATNKPRTINQMLLAYKDQIAAALPRHMTPDRVARLAMTEVRKNPKLGDADPISLFGAIIQCSQLGMEPGIDAYLVPFWNSKRRVNEVQCMPDYRGLIDLARRSGVIGRFEAHAVKEGDSFEYEFGTSAKLVHKPGQVRGASTHFYAIAESTDKVWTQFEVMSKADVDTHRARSRSKDSGPWVTDYDAMGKKTVSRQLCKFLPRSVEVRRAVQMDDLVDAGVSQHNAAVLEGELADDEQITFQEPAPVEKKRAAPKKKVAAKKAPPAKEPDEPAANVADSEANAPDDAVITIKEVLKAIGDAETNGDLTGLDDAENMVPELNQTAQRIAKLRIEDARTRMGAGEVE